MFKETLQFIRTLYPDKNLLPLHEPTFAGKEKEYVVAAIDSSFVSSVGEYVDRFEAMICQLTGARYAVATVNGTAALHTALLLAGVEAGTEVITQPLSFVATANAIAYCGAEPVFLDVDRETLGLSPQALRNFLATSTEVRQQECYNKRTGRKIKACVPMHTFGHPCRIDAIIALCQEFYIRPIEDAAEALGSLYEEKHTGTFGLMGIYSFNGNKTITCGGGGAIVTNDANIAAQAKHLTTTAKTQHPFAYRHDALGFNYRMPNLNAALGCAQLEQLEGFIAKKRKLAKHYSDFFATQEGIDFVPEPSRCRSNYWLNAILLPDLEKRDAFLAETHAHSIFTRPAWELLNTLPMYKNCQADSLAQAKWLSERLVNIPSSVVP